MAKKGARTTKKVKDLQVKGGGKKVKGGVANDGINYLVAVTQAKGTDFHGTKK